MSDLVEFLRAKLDEDEAKSGRFHRLLCLATDYEADDRPCTCGYPVRVLREVEAKRQIVNEAGYYLEHGDGEARIHATHTLESLAVIYSDHADYRDEWP